jgi:hypothetical protein
MNDIMKRMMLFLIGCMGVRFFLVYLSKNINIDYLPYLGYCAILLSIGFMYIFLTGSRKTGPEVLGGKIWWNNLRPLHSILYGLFAYLAITKNKNAWKVLLVDAVIGLFSFLIFHYKEGNFAKL